MPTPYVSTDMVEDTPAVAAAKTVRILRAAEIQAIPAAGQRRSSRDRQATPFVKENPPLCLESADWSCNRVRTQGQTERVGSCHEPKRSVSVSGT
ncbi:PRKG2 [Symbiodinium microadriaticum]|nr:PRKG2 [Symbiodinium microadriaticum]